MFLLFGIEELSETCQLEKGKQTQALSLRLRPRPAPRLYGFFKAPQHRFAVCLVRLLWFHPRLNFGIWDEESTPACTAGQISYELFIFTPVKLGCAFRVARSPK
jgi:hypothetical protein